MNMLQNTNPSTQMRKILYIAIGLVCAAAIVSLVFYQGIQSKVQTPVQNTPTPKQQTAQPVNFSSQAQESTKVQKPIDISLLEQEIHQIANQVRESNGVQPIDYDPKLAEIAREHSQDMALHQFLSHNSYSGHNLNYRYAFADYDCHAKVGYSVSTSNENVAVVTAQGNETQIAQNIVNTWFVSMADRNNILDSVHQTEGIGIAFTGNKMAVYATDDLC